MILQKDKIMSKTDHNQHLLNAISNVFKDEPSFIEIEEAEIKFLIQSGPVSESGRNGCDATDIIRYAIGLYRSFNSSHPCRENSCTITKLEEALHWQEARTRDRNTRGVEGFNKD